MDDLPFVLSGFIDLLSYCIIKWIKNGCIIKSMWRFLTMIEIKRIGIFLSSIGRVKQVISSPTQPGYD